MSTPLHPHLLRREIERGSGGQYISARRAQMRCDGAMGLCPVQPARAPFLIVPASPWRIFGPKPLVVPTVLHYCERHKDECTPALLLRGIRKAQLEQIAKAKWAHEYKPNFDAVRIKWLLVTTPEYGAFLDEIELRPGRPVFGGIPLL